MNKAIEQLILKNTGLETVVEINNVETNNDGFNNDITMFHLSFFNKAEEFSKRVVLKKFSHRVSFNKELHILKSESMNNYINIPTLYFEDKENRLLLMEHVEGVTLDKYIISSANEMRETFEKFGSTLAHIHSIDVQGLNNEYFKNDQLNNCIESLKNRVTGFEDPIYRKILKNIEQSFKGVKFSEVLNHGDYHFWNTIMTNDNKLYILDWEKAFLGDHRFDIANTLVLGYSWFGMDFKEPLLAAYQNVSNKEIEYLECFEALLCFDSFTKTVPLIYGADDSHIRDRTFEWLKRRYELFVKHTGERIEKAEQYLFSKGLAVKIS
ncbi:aminoglycoside phosphotransferase family protein [Lysinibacillus louembei]|uniref:Aminoglycoside phosphotransferase family protein n=1 Tax=Lysinibacillus louembei TaxID=1470088 RepID=A0ABZ0RTX0_9BACI|nr:aminoglycoside phosphotransferase family protein [Lysinibacillus louembei]WPK10756.1 aminoglycoside phosphotransferase family protein [Lysinibacillus louembei]